MLDITDTTTVLRYIPDSILGSERDRWRNCFSCFAIFFSHSFSFFGGFWFLVRNRDIDSFVSDFHFAFYLRAYSIYSCIPYHCWGVYLMLSGAVYYLLEFCLSIASIRMAVVVFGFGLWVDMEYSLYQEPSFRLCLLKHSRLDASHLCLLAGYSEDHGL
jgi:hypothetical protein